jgi:hypothetical protein
MPQHIFLFRLLNNFGHPFRGFCIWILVTLNVCFFEFCFYADIMALVQRNIRIRAYFNHHFNFIIIISDYFNNQCFKNSISYRNVFRYASMLVLCIFSSLCYTTFLWTLWASNSTNSKIVSFWTSVRLHFSSSFLIVFGLEGIFLTNKLLCLATNKIITVLSKLPVF